MMENNRFINREISWLYFNNRVLQEAENKDVPLIERLRFLGIFSNNLDEFFRVRVATIRRLLKIESKKHIVTEVSLQNLLNQIQELVIFQQKKFRKTYDDILKELKKNNIYVANENGLTAEQQTFLTTYYKEKIEPVLVPIMLKNAPRFPYLQDKAFYLFVIFRAEGAKKEQYSLIEVPIPAISRFVEIPSVGKKRFIMLSEDLIRFNLPQIFSIFNPQNIQSFIIKVTRDAELDLDDDISASFYDKLKKSLEKRKKGATVRFIYDESMPVKYLNFLLKKMKLNEEDNIIPGGRYHNFKDFMRFPNVGTPDLEYHTQKFISHPVLADSNSILNAIARQDILLHFPFHHFDFVIDMLREAAIDPTVTSIRISLYRVARDSKIVNALINAARNGKRVIAVVELQARFDEEANLQWSKILTDEGVQILFGISGLKVHSKLVVIERKTPDDLQNFAFIGTGNFHEGTARVYSDVALLTANKLIADEARKVFDFLEKPYLPTSFRHLIVAPVFLRNKLNELIDFEIAQAKKGNKAFIRLKLNSLLDEELINKLYEASSLGVKINLIIRGICSIIPGVKGLSENISAISIVDRYLEHSRIMHFYHQGEDLMYISSADWMQRNLDHRVEVACPIYEPALKKEIKDLLDLQFADNVKARIFDGNQSDKFVANNKKRIRSQVAMFDYLNKRVK